MKYLFVLNHPAHFHLFKYTIKGLSGYGHTCIIIAREKDVLCDLLEEDDFDYIKIDSKNNLRYGILLSSIIFLFKKIIFVWKYTSCNRPDIMIGTDWSIAIVGRLRSISNMIFNEDDTIATPENKLFYPISNLLVLPDCCDKGLWDSKKITYPGYHEMAYLHPQRFKYDKALVERIINDKRPYIIIRLVSLTASHDIGKVGLAESILHKIIDISAGRYKILISFEGTVLSEFDKYNYKFNPAVMHQLLAGAHLVIGDSQTMTAEAAVLGTPAIRFNDFVGKLGYLDELENKYELSFGFHPSQQHEFLNKVQELLENAKLKKHWKIRQEQLFKNKIDVTKFFIWLLSNYPYSVKNYKFINLNNKFG